MSRAVRMALWEYRKGMALTGEIIILSLLSVSQIVIYHLKWIAGGSASSQVVKRFACGWCTVWYDDNLQIIFEKSKQICVTMSHWWKMLCSPETKSPGWTGWRTEMSTADCLWVKSNHLSRLLLDLYWVVRRPLSAWLHFLPTYHYNVAGVCDSDVDEVCQKAKNNAQNKGIWSIGAVGRCLSRQLAEHKSLTDQCQTLVAVAAPKVHFFPLDNFTIPLWFGRLSGTHKHEDSVVPVSDEVNF